MQATQQFTYSDLKVLLAQLLEDCVLTPDDRQRGFTVENPAGERLLLRLPPIAPIPLPEESAADYALRLGVPESSFLIVLVQAGATSMGYWAGGDLLCHKVIKKYVTRGNGKAQTTYLKTRGKSRYGSRLRLQNAKAHLVETNEKLHEWFQLHGRPARIFYSCPIRLWPELFEMDPAPPFQKTDPLSRIGMDVRVPSHEELFRVRRFLDWGSLCPVGE